MPPCGNEKAPTALAIEALVILGAPPHPDQIVAIFQAVSTDSKPFLIILAAS